MAKKKTNKCKTIKIPAEPCNLSKAWIKFIEELNQEKSEGDIQQDRLRSSPKSILPMV